jgi:dGTPase
MRDQIDARSSRSVMIRERRKRTATAATCIGGAGLVTQWQSTHYPRDHGKGVSISGDVAVSIDRQYTEARSAAFRSDRRILAESRQLARLKRIGQVFPGGGRGYCDRLAHTTEVAEVAHAIADALGLDTNLVDAIALGHDCGHPPFSHVGENVLRRFWAGFHHASYGADWQLAGLGLTTETRDGVRNHSWSRPSPTTPEGEVVRWADRITYLSRDFADSAELGFCSRFDLPSIVRHELGDFTHEQRKSMAASVISASLRSGFVAIEQDAGLAMGSLRQFNSEKFYTHPLVSALATSAEWHLINALKSAAACFSAARLPRSRSRRKAVLMLASLDDEAVLSRAWINIFRYRW